MAPVSECVCVCLCVCVCECVTAVCDCSLTSAAVFSDSSSFSWASFRPSENLSSSSSVCFIFFWRSISSSSSCNRRDSPVHHTVPGQCLFFCFYLTLYSHLPHCGIKCLVLPLCSFLCCFIDWITVFVHNNFWVETPCITHQLIFNLTDFFPMMLFENV